MRLSPSVLVLLAGTALGGCGGATPAAETTAPVVAVSTPPVAALPATNGQATTVAPADPESYPVECGRG